MRRVREVLRRWDRPAIFFGTTIFLPVQNIVVPRRRRHTHALTRTYISQDLVRRAASFEQTTYTLFQDRAMFPWSTVQTRC